MGPALPESFQINIVEVLERNPPKGEAPVQWVLITTLPVVIKRLKPKLAHSGLGPGPVGLWLNFWKCELGRLDAFDVIIIDDLGYIQQDRDEMEVLFTLLAERYERRSVMITSNLVFSQWDQIFKDPMTTAAAVDRMVHHSIILEMTGASVRHAEAMSRAEDASTAEPPM